MKFAYEDLGDDQFEQLIVYLCQKLLGIAVQGFSKGPDGGRDAKFVGTAERFPSRAAPWKGTVIIQAKHTNGYNRNFSESDFYSPGRASSVLHKEVVRLTKLRSKKQVDHYILFANRRLAANAESDIRSYIARESKIPEESIYLCGVEQMETWLKTYPDVPGNVNLDPVDSPLIISPEDLSEVVSALALQRASGFDIPDDLPTPRVAYDKKNDINNMSAEYAKALRQKYLKETKDIYSFLSAPENHDKLKQYEDVVDEFQLKIIAKRKEHQNFDSVMNHLLDLLFNRDPILRKHKKLTRTMLFYMYWNCDIGETECAKTD